MKNETKIILFVIYIILTTAVRKPLVQIGFFDLPVITAAAFVIMLLTAAISKVPARYILKRTRFVTLLILIGAVITFVNEGMNKESIDDGVFYFVRLFSLAAMSVILMKSADTYELLKAVQKVFFIKEEYALSVIIALEFIPMLQDEFERLREARLMRGIDIRKGFGALSMIVPVFVSTLKKAKDIENMLNVKCFHPLNQSPKGLSKYL